MSQFATLGTGAGVVTPVTGLGQLEENIVIGSIDTTMPLSGFKVVVGSKTVIDIQNSTPLISTFAKFMQRVVGSGVVGLILKISTGRIITQGISIFFTNAGATTPNIFWYSDNSGGSQSVSNGNANGRALNAVTVNVNASTNQTFTNFAGLFITPQANVNSFDVVFADGTSQNMSTIEANALFATKNDTQATGVLDAVVTGFDNRDLSIISVRVNVGATAVTVLIVS